MRLDVGVDEQLAAELVRRAPWMHPFQLGEATVLGLFKYHGIDETVCVPGSPPPLVARMRAAFDDYMRGEPFRLIDDVVDRLGPGTYLDIGAATGRYSFALARAGATVTGVEIRPEQVDQAQLLASLDDGLRGLAVSFEHDATSADDPSFRAGETYDVAVSWGLLYHLSNPVEHLRNLRRLSRRAAVVNTLTHHSEAALWLLLRSDPSWMTKSVAGVGWVPHFSELPTLLRDVGFSRVEILFHPLTEGVQRHWLARASESATRRRARLFVPPIIERLVGRPHAQRLRHEAETARKLYQNASYFTYVAYC